MTTDPGTQRAEQDKVLARVRALLAKAESTEFDDEAQALTAKAQELISRHSLELLMDRAQGGATAGFGMTSRSIRLDPPYAGAKSYIVGQVAAANRCRVVVSHHTICTVIGEEQDIEAVELLVASLLVQALAALRRHGSQADWTGTSRTRSFRHAFYISFAARIGERLREAMAAVQEQSAGAALVRVLAEHEKALDHATHELFPRLTPRAKASVTNRQGWAAGRAAADRVELGPRTRLSAP